MYLLGKQISLTQGFKYAMKQVLRVARQEVILLTKATMRIDPKSAFLPSGQRIIPKDVWAKRAIKLIKIVKGIRVNIKDVKKLLKQRKIATKKEDDLEKEVEKARELKDDDLTQKKSLQLASTRKNLRKIIDEFKQKAEEDQGEVEDWAKQMKIRNIKELVETLFD